MRYSKEMLYVVVCEMHRKHICVQQSKINWWRDFGACIFFLFIEERLLYTKSYSKKYNLILFYPNSNITLRRIKSTGHSPENKHYK